MRAFSHLPSGNSYRWRAAAAGVGGLLLTVAACSSGSHSTAAGGGSDKSVTVATVGSVGHVLVDSTGATLYVNNRDTASHQMCTTACQVFWQPLTVSGHATPTGGSGVSALGVQTTSAGRQVTYHGQPLYTFTQDHSSGQANGNDFTDSFGGVRFAWRAATPGAATAPANSAPANSAPAGGGYGGGY